MPVNLLEGTFVERRNTGEVIQTYQLPERFINPNGHSGEIIGAGAQGAVIAVTDRTTNTSVALKQIRLLLPIKASATEEEKVLHQKKQQRHAQCVTREWKMLEMVCHPHIVSFLSAFHAQNFLYLEMEKMDYSIAHLIASRRAESNLLYTAFLLHQVLDAVDYLDKNNIMHRDIKPANIGVNFRDAADGKTEFTMKLFDLGLSRYCGKEVSEHTKQVGSVLYQAPEILFCRTSGYGTKVDVWSVFVTALELLTGVVDPETKVDRRLFMPLPADLARPGGMSTSYVMKKMLFVCGIPTATRPYSEAGYEINFRVQVTPRRPISEWINAPILMQEGNCNETNFFDLLEKIFVFDPNSRLDAEECLKHDFFNGLDEIFRRKCTTPLSVQPDYTDQLMRKVLQLGS